MDRLMIGGAVLLFATLVAAFAASVLASAVFLVYLGWPWSPLILLLPAALYGVGWLAERA